VIPTAIVTLRLSILCFEYCSISLTCMSFDRHVDEERIVLSEQQLVIIVFDC
jgi:hypothetical protein